MTQLAFGRFMITGSLMLSPLRRLRAKLRGCDSTLYRNVRHAGRLTCVIVGEGPSEEVLERARRDGAKVVGEVEVEEHWGLFDSRDERLSRLRSLAQRPASYETWIEIATVLELWPCDPTLEIAVRYVQDLTHHWPEHHKVGFVHWWHRAASSGGDLRLELAHGLNLENQCPGSASLMLGLLTRNVDPSQIAHLTINTRQLRSLAAQSSRWPVLRSLRICPARPTQPDPWHTPPDPSAPFAGGVLLRLDHNNFPGLRHIHLEGPTTPAVREAVRKRLPRLETLTTP